MSEVDTLRDALFGNPPDPTKEPSREGVLAAFTEMSQRIVGVVSGIPAYATAADLPAVTTDDNGKQARVWNDSTASNNTYWIVKDGAWEIDTSFAAILEAAVQPLVDEAEAYASDASDSADAAEAQADSIKSLLTNEELIDWEIAYTNEAKTSVYGGFEKLPDGATRFRVFDILLPDESVTEASLDPDVKDSLTAARYVAELDGGALWSNDLRTGQRVQLAAAGASDAVVKGDAMLYTVGGERVWRPCDGSAAEAPALSLLTSIVHYGDSLTADSRGVGNTGATLGVTSINRGVSGNSVNDIATRAGAISPLLTLSGNALPASGSVDVTAITPSTGWSPYVDVTLSGTILGEAVTMFWDVSEGTRTITRLVAGDEIAVPAGTPFVSSEDPTYRDHVQTIWVGRNAVDTATFEADTLAAVAAMVAHLSAYAKRYVVVSVTNGQNEGIGTTNYDKITACNDKLAALYGDFYYDLRRDFIDDGLTMAGITPTTGDTDAIAADKPPPSLMFDNIHPNDDGYAVQRQLMADWLISKGWFA